VIVDLKKSEIAYCIRKPITSATRARRQRAFRQELETLSFRSTYFGVYDAETNREPFALLHSAAG
jgi:hypothetical protein